MSTKDYLQGMPTEISTQFENRVVKDIPAPSSASVTTCTMHYYANGTSGIDTNDGLSALTPKKTLQAIFDLVPVIIEHNVAVHLSGVFNDQGTVYLRKHVNKGSLYIDGGDDVVILDGPRTADIHSTSTIGLTTAGWTIDALQGYIVEVLTGPAAGEQSTVITNTADTITVSSNWSVDPGHASFRVVRPATEIKSTAVTTWWYNDGSGPSYISYQKLYFSGTNNNKFVTGTVSPGNFRFYHLIFDVNGPGYVFQLTNASYALFWKGSRNMTTFALNTVDKTIVALRKHDVFQNFTNVSYLVVAGLYVSKLRVNNCLITQFSARSRTLDFYNCKSRSWDAFPLCDGGFNGMGLYGDDLESGVGIKMRSSDLGIGGTDGAGSAYTIKHPGTHGIELRNSTLTLNGTLVGSEVTNGAGAYVHENSVLFTRAGATSTLTGSVGDIAVENPAAQQSTWAAIEAGVPVSSTAEMTLIKKRDPFAV
jgi:hypothetical protein